VFEDGTPVRFWGTNLTASALFGTPQLNVMQQARRLSELGFNLVRLHHHDSYWVDPNIFGDSKSPDTRKLNSAMLEKLDWWINCLKEEGIYVWLDLHVQRHLKSGDRIDNFAEISKGRSLADLKGYNYVNPSIRLAMQQFNEAYVNHVNIFTGTAMLITNENDITNHFGNVLLPNRNVPGHNAIYTLKASTFAAAWGLPRDLVWRSWEHGPSKLFLNDLEHRFNIEMLAHLRGQGVRVPVVTTSTWGNPLASLPALTAGDLIDAHAYGEVGELKKNPIHAANLMHWIAAAQVSDKPLSVSEWNVQKFPVTDRHAIPLYLAASARLQGWAALLQYAYAQVPLTNSGSPSNWASFNDPGLIASLPAAALLYRRGDVREADTIYVFSPGKDELFNKLITPDNAVALRTASEKGKLVIALPLSRELPWLRKSTIPAGAKTIADLQQSFISSGATEAVSDTGELKRDWAQGTYTIDTPRTQAAMGRIGGRKIDLSDVFISTTTPNATVSVQSLNANPINKSRAILISLGARSAPIVAGKMPYRSEPVQGQIWISAPTGLKLYSRIRSATQRKEIPAPYRNGIYRIHLDSALGTYWLVLRTPFGLSAEHFRPVHGYLSQSPEARA